jgi:hypothetical protein
VDYTINTSEFYFRQAQAVIVHKPDAPVHHGAIQEVVSARGILGFKPALRLESCGQESKE